MNKKVTTSAALLLHGCASLLYIIGFSTSYWLKLGIAHSGLWQICEVVCINNVDIPLESWFIAVQFFACIGFILMLIGLVFLIYVFVHQMRGSAEEDETSTVKNSRNVIMVVLISAATCGVLAVIIYGAEVKHFLNFSFYLTLLGSIGMAVSGVLARI